MSEKIKSIEDLLSGFLDGVEVALLEEDYKVTDEIFELLTEAKEDLLAYETAEVK